MILLTPGPCHTSQAVRQAAAGPDLNHREPAYRELVRRVRRRLCDVYEWEGLVEPFLLGGSGTAAMEALATSCIRSGPVLILANGYYSERQDAIFGIHRLPHHTLRFGWLDPVDLSSVESELARVDYEAVVVTHNETTTGRLNPLPAIAGLARQFGVRVLVDSMSSFGAEQIRTEDFDALCASSNKCLHGLSGLSFVLVKPEIEAVMESVERRTYYLHLPMYRGEAPPLTPPVPLVSALDRALAEFFEQGGLAERSRTYRERAALVRQVMRGIGAEALVPEEEATSTLSAFRLPYKWTADEFLAMNREIGFELYGCKGELAHDCIQVGHMGEIPEDAL